MKPKTQQHIVGEAHDVRETLRDGIVVAQKLADEAVYLIETSRRIVGGGQQVQTDAPGLGDENGCRGGSS